MHGADNERDIINFLKSVSTATRCLDFTPDEKLAGLPRSTAAHIEELEGLLSRLSLEAEALLWRAGQGHALYPNLNKGGKR